MSSVLALSTMVFFGAGCGNNDGSDDAAFDEQAMEGEALVGVRDGAFGKPAVEAAIAQVGSVIDADEKGGVYHVRLKSGMTVDSAAAKIAAGDVLYVEPNWQAHQYAPGADTNFTNQYSALIQAQLNTSATGAWARWGTKTGGTPTAIKIAVVDDGVKGNHPDLVNKMAAGRDILLGADIGAGADSSTSSGSHGTEVAGVAAAEIGNTIGISGIAANSVGDAADPVAVKIVPVKVTDSTHALTHASIAAGINWVANPSGGTQITGSGGGALVVDSGSLALTTPVTYARRADIILLSLGSGAPSWTLQKAIENAWAAGCLVVAAAGNGSTSLMKYPAAYQGSKQNVLSVTSVSQADKLSSNANYGSWINVAGPGEDIITTTAANNYTDGALAPKVNGSSYSAAYVAGAAALVWSAYAPVAGGSEAVDRLTNLQLRSLLIASVDSIDKLPRKTLKTNAGRLNVQSAMANVSNLTNTSVQAAPASVVLSGATVVSGGSLTGSVILTRPATANLTVTLVSSDSTTLSLGTTTTITIKSGSSAGSFKVTAAKGVTVATTVDITATADSGSAKSTVTVLPPVLAVSAFALNQKSTVVWDTPGTTGTLTGTVTLTGVTQGSQFLWLRVSDSGVTLKNTNGTAPESYVNSSGYTVYKFSPATTSFLAQPEPVLVAVSYSIIAFVGADENAYNASNRGKSVTFKVSPALVSFLLNPKTITGGGDITGTATLAAFPPVTQTVTVTLDTATCPSVVYLPGQLCSADISIPTTTKTGTVTITALAPSAAKVTVTASLLGVDKRPTLVKLSGAAGGN
jgi:thermitase